MAEYKPHVPLAEIKIPPNPLFAGMTQGEQKNLLECFGAGVRLYDKGENLIWENESVDNLGIILEGTAEASKLDAAGNRFIIARPGRGSVFGDVLSLHHERRSPVTLTALAHVTALLIPVGKLLRPCPVRCAEHDKLIRNLLNSVSEKYFDLQDRIGCLTQPTVRAKVLYYLERASAPAARRGRVVEIPYDRAALADYLHVERSALSRELSAMKREGLIDYHKNAFRVL